MRQRLSRCACPIGVPAPSASPTRHGMAKAPAPFVSVYVAAGMPAEFIAQLEAADDAIIAAVGNQAENRVQ